MDNPDIDFEKVSQLYLAKILKSWEESYQAFEELEYAGKREFIQGGSAETSMEVYDQMMQSARHAFVQDGSYELSHEETTNAFIYSANEEDVSPEDFRNIVSEILEGKKKWKDFAEGSV